MIIEASAKSVHISPRKVGVVAALVRGRSVKDALVILDHTPRGAALPLKKLIQSAQANAEHNHKLATKSLVIHELSIGNGPRMKRFRPAAHGRALPYHKRSSHIYVKLEGSEATSKKVAKSEATDKKEKK